MEFDEEIRDLYLNAVKWVEEERIGWAAEEANSQHAYGFSVPLRDDEFEFNSQVHGQVNLETKELHYLIEIEGIGEVYRLDFDSTPHPNPEGDEVLDPVHKHIWTEKHGMNFGYEPDDITAPRDEARAVWHQFCDEANILHEGRLDEQPRSSQTGLV